MALTDPVGLAGDVAAAATALSGLMLVYIGSVTAAYGGYEPEAKAVVRGSFRLRAWFGFGGMLAAVSAAGLGLLGKWENSRAVELWAIGLLAASLAWAMVIAALTALEVS